MTRVAALLALALLALALALRLPRGDLAEWKGDEAIEWAKARAIAREGARPRGLPTTEGPRAPAHPLYAFALPLVLDDRPEACRVEVALLWSAAAVALFWAGRRLVGSRAALALALVWAAHPDLVRRGRAAWYPNLEGPVAACVLLALLATVRAPRGRAAGVLLALAALLALLHYSPAGIAAFAVAACAWAFGQGASRRALALGLGAALALAAPFVAGEVGRGFADTRAALSVAAHGGRASQDPGAPERGPLAYPRALVRALDLEGYARTLGPAGEIAARASGPPRGLLFALSAGLVLLAGAGAALGAVELREALRRRARPGPAGVALAFVVAGWAPFLLLRLPARDHYVQAALPGVLALAALALERGARRARWSRALAAAFLLVFASASVLEVRAVLRTVEAGRVEPGSAYDLPLGEKQAACELVLDRELELVRYRRFEDVLLLEECYRELSRREPERAARFELVRLHESYWDLSYEVPRPRAPRGRVELVLAGPEKLPGEVARAGRIALVTVP